MATYFKSPNPCLCTQAPNTTVPTGTCPAGSGCFCICNDYISPDSVIAAPPCGSSSYDLLSISHSFGVCNGNPVVFNVVSFDDGVFTNVAVTGSTLSWWVKDVPERSLGIVEVKASCGIYGKTFNVSIGVKNLCKYITCPDCYKCNPCTGGCEKYCESDIAVEINPYKAPAEIGVTIKKV